MMPEEIKGKETGATEKEGYVSASLNKDGSVSLSVNLSQEEFAEMVIDTYNYGEYTLDEEELKELKRANPDLDITKVVRCKLVMDKPFEPICKLFLLDQVCRHVIDPPVPACIILKFRCRPLEKGLIAVGIPKPGCKVIGNIQIGDDLIKVLTNEALAQVIKVRTEELQKNIAKRIGG